MNRIHFVNAHREPLRLPVPMEIVRRKRHRRAALICLIVAGVLSGILFSGCAPDPDTCSIDAAEIAPRIVAGPTMEEHDAAITWGLAFWEADASILDGWSVVYVEANGIAPDVWGRSDACSHMIAIDTSFACDTWSLPHEIGHLALGLDRGAGDPYHTDPRWRELLDIQMNRGGCVWIQ